ncbi:DUF4097 family beta strand repeat-containing protein [Arthrobacter sp. H5]|uniref:DUF4097 family beta strand repeat-containing protein n=1 Tax=Arthrobacter sp. H5 TaxID=1267973 RepID=UPI00047F3082|nr:DUF4097 family beta strand repeat-containing protein [Arthrobacter sp. H5]
MEENQWSVDEPRTIDVDGVTKVKAGIIAGRIDVLVHDEPMTRVEVSEVSGQPIDVSLTNGVLELRHQTAGSRGLGWLGMSGQVVTGRTRERAVISIAVPAGTTVALHTVNGDGLACGTRDTTLDTVSGSVMADDTAGLLTIGTVSGEAIVRHHSGRLVAKSVSGEITAPGYLESIRTNSVSGDTTLDLLGTPRDLALKTVSGNVSIRLSSEIGIEVSSKSVSGTLTVNDQRLSGRGKNTHSEPGTTSKRMNIHASSVSGDIAIFHRDSDARRDSAGIELHDGTL